MAQHRSLTARPGRSTRAARRLGALVLLAAALAGCGGGGGGSDAGEPTSSMPTIPANPNYQQKVIALFAGSYTLDCSTGGSANQVQRVVGLSLDGVLRTTGLTDVDASAPTSTVNVLASYLQHPLYNTTAPGVYLSAKSPLGEAALEFTFVNASTLRLMKVSHIAKGVTTSCLTAPTIGGVNSPNTVAWNGAAFLNDTAYANRTATCTPSQGDPYTVDLTIGTKLSQQISVPIDPASSPPSEEDGFGYLSTDSDGTTVNVEIHGAQNPTRVLTWHGVHCAF
jgi:hypothetical protein